MCQDAARLTRRRTRRLRPARVGFSRLPLVITKRASLNNSVFARDDASQSRDARAATQGMLEVAMDSAQVEQSSLTCGIDQQIGFAITLRGSVELELASDVRDNAAGELI